MNWIANENNPLLVLFYAFLMGVGLYVFFRMAYIPHLLKSTEMSTIEHLLIALLIGGTLTSYYLAIVTDPGVVTSDNHAKYMKYYQFDNVVFVPGNECRTCHLEKPARSKHCSICKACVMHFDHHCPWIMNCVGMYNRRWFLGFLIGQTLVCLYGVFLMIRYILKPGYYEYVAYLIQRVRAQQPGNTSENEELYSYDDQTGQYNKLGFWAVFWWYAYTTENVIFLVALCLFACLVSAMLGGFGGYHLYMAMNGTTTNEIVKLDEYKWTHPDFDVKRETRLIYGRTNALSKWQNLKQILLPYSSHRSKKRK